MPEQSPTVRGFRQARQRDLQRGKPRQRHTKFSDKIFSHMKSTPYHILLLLLALAGSRTITSAQNAPAWQANLQTKFGYYLVPHRNGDDQLASQFAGEAGLDRSLGKYWGLGLTLGYTFLYDDQPMGGGGYTAPGIREEWELEQEMTTNALSLKFAPFARLPLGKSSLTLRPAAGLVFVSTKQGIEYDFSDNGTTFTKFDDYTYEGEWMAAVALSGEYSYHFSEKFGVFASLGYENWFTRKQKYTVTSDELPLSEFPTFMQFSVAELRRKDGFSGPLHRFGDFGLLQVGLGVRLSLGR